MTTYIGIALILFLFAYLGWMVGIVQGWKAGEQVYTETLAELDRVKADRDGYKAPFTALNKQLQDRFLRREESLFVNGRRLDPMYFRKQNDTDSFTKGAICRLFDVPEGIVGETDPLPLWGANVFTYPPHFREKKDS